MTVPEGLGQQSVVMEVGHSNGYSGSVKIGALVLNACIVAGFGGSISFAGYEIMQARKTCEIDASGVNTDGVNEALHLAENNQIQNPERVVTDNGTISSTQLKFADGTVTFYTPFVDKTKIKDTSGQSLFNRAQMFAKLYGIDLEPYSSNRDSLSEDDGAIALQQNDLEKISAKQTLIGVMEGLSTMPVEFVKKMGVKHIYLAAYLKDMAGLAVNDGGAGNVYLDSSVPINSQIVVHEMTHILDGNLCGNGRASSNDPNYTNHNSDDIYLNNSPDLLSKPPSSMAQYQSTARGAKTIEKIKTNCNEFLTILSSVEVETDYGYTNVLEDKAELGSAILTDNTSGGTFDPRSPRLRAKAIELLARIRRTSSVMADFIVWRYQQDTKIESSPRCYINNP